MGARYPQASSATSGFDVPAGIVDPGEEFARCLEFSHLGGDEAQHDGRSLWHEAQGLEPSCPLGVVLQEKAVEVQAVEHRFGDSVVVPLPVPHACPVASADVEAEHGPAFEPGDRTVAGPDRRHQVLQGVLAPRLHVLQALRVDVAGVAGFVELHIRAAGLDESAHDLSMNCDDVVEELLARLVVRSRLLEVAHLRHAVGPHHHCLGRPLGLRRRERPLLEGEAVDEAELPGGGCGTPHRSGSAARAPPVRRSPSRRRCLVVGEARRR